MRIELDDVTLNLQDTGAGSPVMLLHGWPDCASLWRHQVPALVAAGYRVLTPDLRGFGDSSKPAETEAYAAPRMVGDVGSRHCDRVSVVCRDDRTDQMAAPEAPA